MGVVMTTIVWSLGVATLVPSVVSAADASCPTLVAGDLIKVSGKPAIYALDNNLNYRYFPDGDVFKSWNADESYSKYYKTISQACFDSLAQPAQAPYHVFYRAGSYLVKYLSSDTLYVVSLNNKLIPITDAAAKAIFGTNYTWKTIGLSEWPLYTKDTTTITEATVYPGMLVKADGKTYFVDEGKVLREVTAEGMTANRFKTAFVRTVSITGLTTGATIGSEITSLTKRVGDSTTPGTPVASGNLTVALAMDTPAANSVPQNGTRVPFTKVNLTAGASNAINVDAITIKRTGLSNYTQFAGSGKVWIEKNGVRVSSQSAMNSSDEVNLTFSPVLNIPAGQTVTVEIVASLNNEGGNGALGISAASAVSAGGVTVGGSYPIFGNLMSFTDYKVATAEVTFGTGAKTPKVGDTAAELATFDVTQTATSSKDIIFKSIMLRNNGYEDMSKALANVYLEKAGAVISSNGVINGRYITFTLNDGGLLIEKGDFASFKVKGDIMAKENTNPGFTFLVNKTEDVSIIEKSTGFGAAVTKDNGTNDVNIQAGALSITKKSTQPTDATVIKGTNGTVSLVANVRADEAIKAEGVQIDWEGTAVTSSFQNIKVYLNGFLLGTFDPDNNTGTKEIETSVTFNKGDNELRVTADAKTDATNGAEFKAKIVATKFLTAAQSPEYVASGNKVTLPDDVNGSPIGATIKIEGGTLTISNNDGYVENRKIVQGKVDVVLGKFNVKAENDNITITSISAGNNTGTGDKVAHTSVYDMKIKVDGTQVGSTRDFNASGASFGGLNVVINKDQVRTIEVLASFDTASTGSIKTVLTLYNQDSRGKVLADKTGTTVNQVVIDAGTLTIAQGATTKDASIILAKSGVEHDIAQFRFTSQDDISNITEMVIINSSTNPVDSRVSSVRLYKGTTMIAEDFFMSGSATLKISGDKLIVPANGSENISVKVVLNPIDTANQSSTTIRALLSSLKYKGSAGTEISKTSADFGVVAGNTMQIRKTMPTFAKVSLDTTGNYEAQEDIFKFTITADGNEDVYINTLKFVKIGNNTAGVTDFYLFQDGTDKTPGVVTGTPNFVGLNLLVGKGSASTFIVKGDTSGLSKDDTFGLSLSKGTLNDNILWGEYFVPTNNPGDAEYLFTLPLSHTKKF